MTSIQESLRSTLHQASSLIGIEELSDGIQAYRKGDEEKGIAQIKKGAGKLAVTTLSLYGAYQLLFARSIESGHRQSELFQNMTKEQQLGSSSFQTLAKNRLNNGWEYAEELAETCKSRQFVHQPACEKASTPFVSHLLETYPKGMRSWPERGKAIIDQCMENDSPFCQNMGRELVKQSVDSGTYSTATKLVKKCSTYDLNSKTCTEMGRALTKHLFQNDEGSSATRLAGRCLKKGAPICKTFIPETMETIIKTKAWNDAATLLKKCQKSNDPNCATFVGKVRPFFSQMKDPSMGSAIYEAALDCLSSNASSSDCKAILDNYSEIASGRQAITFGSALLESKNSKSTERLKTLLNYLARAEDAEGGQLASSAIQKKVPGVSDAIKAVWSSHLSNVNKNFFWNSRTDLDQLQALTESALNSNDETYHEIIKKTFVDIMKGDHHTSSYHRWDREKALEKILKKAFQKEGVSPCNEPLHSAISSMLRQEDYYFSHTAQRILQSWAGGNDQALDCLPRIKIWDRIHEDYF